MAKIGATGGNTDGAMGSFAAPRVGGFSGNKKQPTTSTFQDRFFTSLKREGRLKAREEGPANKIVKFGAGVKAKDPGNGSLIKSISTNINNQFGDAITQLQSNVTNIVSPVLDRLKAEHRRSIDDAESNKPTNLLGGFLDMLRSGLDFIRFLSDRKRLAFLRQGIKNLKTAFNELFIVGETVAKTLKKLIKQLKKLGQEGGKGGGFRLPGMPRFGGFGGGNKRPPRKPNQRPAVRPRPRRRGMGTAGMILGTGGLLAGGMAMAPAVQGSPTAPPELPEPIVEQPLSKTLLDKFDKVLDMFKGALDNLSKPAKQQPPPSPSGGTGATGGGTPASSAGAGGGALPTENQDLYTTAALASMEGGSDQARADVAQAVYNRMGQRGMSATEVATERGQFAVMFDENDNIDADAKNITSLEAAVQFRMKKKGETAEVAEQQIRQTIAAMRNPELVKNSQTFVQDRTSFRASAKNYQTLSNSIFRGSAADNQFLNEERSGVGTVAVPEFVSGVEVDPNKVKVEAAPEQSQVMKKVSQQVAQPARKGGEVSVVPVGGGGGQPAPAVGGGRGPANKMDGGGVPFMSSSMKDNAHDMFSRMTYNVVG